MLFWPAIVKVYSRQGMSLGSEVAEAEPAYVVWLAGKKEAMTALT